MASTSLLRKRAALLIVAVGSVLIVARVFALVSGEADAVEPAVRARAPRASARPSDEAAAPAAATDLQIARLAAQQQAWLESPVQRHASLFGVVAWQAPAPKAAPPPPPPKPVAPPFPYAYTGSLLADGVRTVFFAQGDRVLPVKAGDTVDAVYRVDQMTDKQMTLTYLPLNETLVLALGAGR